MKHQEELVLSGRLCLPWSDQNTTKPLVNMGTERGTGPLKRHSPRYIGYSRPSQAVQYYVTGKLFFQSNSGHLFYKAWQDLGTNGPPGLM